MFSPALRSGSSLKSWKTQPTLRRSRATFERLRRVRSRPPTTIRPDVGSISLSSRRTTVDLPEPDAPTTNTNSPLSIVNETALSATTLGSQTFVTFSNTTLVPGLWGGQGPRRMVPGGCLHDLACRLRQQVRVDEAVERTVEHALGVPHLEVGAMVLDELVGMEHVAADLA